MIIITRENAIRRIINSWGDDFYQWDIGDILRYGIKGVEAYTNNELAEELRLITDEAHKVIRDKSKPKV